MRRLLLPTLLCGLLFADGGLFPSGSIEIYESGQTAIIRHSQGRERLCLATQFYTQADSLAWVVPVPSEPEVESAGIDLFYGLARFTAPIYRYESGLSCFGSNYALDGGERSGDSTGVREVGSGIIGTINWQVLQAFQTETLEDYLISHGYSLPSGCRAVLEHYLNQSWNYFFVARTSDTSEYHYWPSLGITLSFDSDSIVYPLHISRVSAHTSRLVFYLLAEHRQMFTGAQLRFSGKVTQDSFPRYPGFLDREYHLTKLTKTLEPAQMEDITFRNAPDDQPYREVQYGSGYWLMYGAVMLGAIALQLRRRRTRV
jgi:hypothetical protein